MADPDLQVENGNYTRIVNKSLEELVKVSLLGAEYAVVLFVIRKTYGFGKTEDQISLSQFEEGTNRSRPTVMKALKNLQLVNILQLVKVGDSKTASSIWRFNKYYTTWKLVKPSKLVKDRSSTGKEKLKQLVKTPLHTKDNTKENTKVVSPKLPKEKKKRSDSYADPRPESLQEYVDKMRKSPLRHMNLLAEYADEIQVSNKTRGQWNEFTARHVANAAKLAAYDDVRIAKAMDKLMSQVFSDRNPRGHITKWDLGTVLKHID